MSIMYPDKQPVVKEAARHDVFVLSWEPPMTKAAGLTGATVVAKSPYTPDVSMIIKRAFGELARIKKGY
jgi:hypothetical protein